MSRFKFSVSLKQHTPIIHFQANQRGATLRATELKPKLDQWIIEQHGGFSNVPWAWKSPSPDPKIKSLKYKVRVLSNVDCDTWGTRGNAPMYFGDMGGGEEKQLLYNRENLDLHFFSFDADLVIYLKNNIHTFFNQVNFGTRQNKGYGSFSVLDNNGQIIYPQNYRYIEFNIERNDLTRRTQHLFTVLQFYYQRLKSGINYCPPQNQPVYHHSFLKLYISQNTNSRWEKPWIKSQMTNLTVPLQKNEAFARAFLGLPYEFRFMSQAGRRCNPNANQHPLPSRNFNVRVEDPKGQIKRIKSPVTLKPFLDGDTVRAYIIPKAFKNPPVNVKFKFSNGRSTDYLATPGQIINFDDLIDQYHAHLGNTFNAMDYSGSFQTLVNVH